MMSNTQCEGERKVQIKLRMLIKSFEPEIVDRPTVLFRGRHSYFWKRKIFKNLEPYNHNSCNPDIPGDSTEKPFHFLIVFDPHRFLAVDTCQAGEIINYLSNCDPAEESIFTIEGAPFFALSYGATQTLTIGPEEDRDLILKLRNNRNVRKIPLTDSSGLDVLNLGKDIRAIEDCVVSFQLSELVASGVIVEDAGNFFIEGMIPIGAGSRVASGVVITGNSRIGRDVHLYPHTYIENSVIGDGCVLLPGSIVRDSELEESVQIGPYAHLRNGTLVKKGAKMGNFVEMKKSVLGQGSKSMHLTYIGDAQVGENVNIGAGTITCNYDGIHKHPTIIEDGVFIGSGTELVAPVTLRKNSYVAAGSTITEDIPPESLAVARQKQRTIPGWVTRKKKKKTP